MTNPSSLRAIAAIAAAISLPIGTNAAPARAAIPAQAASTAPDAAKITIPAPRREFRGVWVATVENIDWPSKEGLSTDQQKAELILLLDRAVQLHLNAVLLQVRPACDALYKSDLEPWSEYLTGTMGKAPEPFYDPLTFAVDEAHRRGLELHAWINPFRARQKGDEDKRPAADGHISKTHPEWVRQYGKLEWLDPGEKAARDYSLAVVLDIVRRYDVDGVHVDDYFYPYKETDAANHEIEFPDEIPWGKYQAGGGKLSHSAWRRANIDDFIERMYREVKGAKPWVKVGISPFGIWRPGNPAQIKGFDSYEQLSGDSRRWLREGWADYFSPQLYWRIEQTPQSFPVLLNWWIGENVLGRHIWPGQYTSQADGQNPKWPQDEIEFQIKTTRGFAGSTGNVHFSASFLLSGDIATTGSLSQRLSETVYPEKAVVPESPWLETATDPAPVSPDHLDVAATTVAGQSGWTVRWPAAAVGAAAPPWQWALQWRAGSDTWHQTIFSGSAGVTEFFIPIPPVPKATGRRGRTENPKPPPPAVVAVTAVDRLGRLGVPTVSVLLPPAPPPPAP